MKKIKIKKDGVDGEYLIRTCPRGFISPLSCQTIGCPYWEGYVFLNAYYYGEQRFAVYYSFLL